ncbi:hypothetical protein DFJ73DRAFT_959608 [Zopfochytrium polystomum]|nr:hypothetical protein DFJ73DRAFT_959608 [Zopfochytrium polystomum]
MVLTHPRSDYAAIAAMDAARASEAAAAASAAAAAASQPTPPTSSPPPPFAKTPSDRAAAPTAAAAAEGEDGGGDTPAKSGEEDPMRVDSDEDDDDDTNIRQSTHSGRELLARILAHMQQQPFDRRNHLDNDPAKVELVVTKHASCAAALILNRSWPEFENGSIDPLVNELLLSAGWAVQTPSVSALQAATRKYLRKILLLHEKIRSKEFERSQEGAWQCIDTDESASASFCNRVKYLEEILVLKRNAKFMEGENEALRRNHERAMSEKQKQTRHVAKRLQILRAQHVSLQAEVASLQEQKLRSEFELRKLRDERGELLSKVATMSGQMRTLDVQAVCGSFDRARQLVDAFLLISEYRAIKFWEPLCASVFELGYESVESRHRQIALLMVAPKSSQIDGGGDERGQGSSESYDRSQKLITGFLQASADEQVRQLLLYLNHVAKFEPNAYTEKLSSVIASSRVTASVASEAAVATISMNAMETLRILMGTKGRRGKTPFLGWNGSLLEAIEGLLKVAVEAALVEPSLSFTFKPDECKPVDVVESGKVAKGSPVIIMPGLLEEMEVKRKLVAVCGTKTDSTLEPGKKGGGNRTLTSWFGF